MVIAERIQESIEKLPLPLQWEVFDFVQYLLSKREHEAALQTEPDWSRLSLALAMRGMEDEDAPAYTPADVNVVF